MIPSGVEIFVGLSPIDLRWGFERLSGIVEEQVGRPARSGTLFVFFGKRSRSLIVLRYSKLLSRRIGAAPGASSAHAALRAGGS